MRRVSRASARTVRTCSSPRPEGTGEKADLETFTVAGKSETARELPSCRIHHGQLHRLVRRAVSGRGSAVRRTGKALISHRISLYAGGDIRRTGDANRTAGALAARDAALNREGPLPRIPPLPRRGNTTTSWDTSPPRRRNKASFRLQRLRTRRASLSHDLNPQPARPASFRMSERCHSGPPLELSIARGSGFDIVNGPSMPQTSPVAGTVAPAGTIIQLWYSRE